MALTNKTILVPYKFFVIVFLTLNVIIRYTTGQIIGDNSEIGDIIAKLNDSTPINNDKNQNLIHLEPYVSNDDSEELDENSLVKDEHKILTKYYWLTGIFDHHRWTRRHYLNVSNECSIQMETYLDALRRGSKWATKMSDASGRYNGQFFFGNDYWLGSYKQCSEMQIEYSSMPSNRQSIMADNQTLPFSINFTVSKIQIRAADLSPHIRILTVGQCLPSSCTLQDVAIILLNDAEDMQNKMANNPNNNTNKDDNIQFKIMTVRPIPGSYTFWNDTLFHVVGCIILFMIFLMLIASMYECYINYSNLHQKNIKEDEIECQNNNYTNIHDNGNKRNDPLPHNNGNINNTNGLNHSNVTTTYGNGSLVHNGTSSDDPKFGKSRKLGRGIFSQILLSFSILSNAEKIMKTEESSEDSITCIHGLRFLSLLWIIMVHTYLQLFHIADNKTLRIITEKNFFYQTVGNASYSVDTFFFMSGFLMTFLYYKSLDAKKIALAKHGEKEQSNSKLKTRGKMIQTEQYAYTNSAALQSLPSNDQQPQVFKINENSNTKFTRKTGIQDIKENISEFAMLLFYRIIRLTPAYLFVISLATLNTRLNISHSVFDQTLLDNVNCPKYWWRNILYINNLYPDAEMCMLWTWYMANDTQFYILGVILLLISRRYFKFSAVFLIVLMVSSWFTTGYISLANNYKVRIQQPFEMFNQLYDKPWSRVGPYLVGMITGWYIHRIRGKVNMSWWLIIIGWISSFGIMFSLVYGVKDGFLEIWPTAFYVSIGHTAWGVAVAWVVLFCLSPQGSLLNRALSYRGMLPLSRLAYCSYLVHSIILLYFGNQLDGPFHLHNTIVLVVFAGTTVISYLLSFLISVTFEAPIVRLLRISINKK